MHVSSAFDLVVPNFLPNPWQQGETKADDAETIVDRLAEQFQDLPLRTVKRIASSFTQYERRVRDDIRRDIEAYTAMREAEATLLVARAASERDAILATMTTVNAELERVVQGKHAAAAAAAADAADANAAEARSRAGAPAGSGGERIGGLPASMFARKENAATGGALTDATPVLTRTTKDVAPALFALEVADGKLVDIDADVVVMGGRTGEVRPLFFFFFFFFLSP
jgi:hypothetical protein